MGSVLYWLFGGAGLMVGAVLAWGANAFILDPIKIDAAVKVAVAQEQSRCTNELAASAAKINDASQDAVNDALEARDALGRTPIDQAELQDLCNSEAAECRDAQAAPKKVTP